MAPSARVSTKRIDMNIAGVEAMPQSTAFAPLPRIAARASFCSAAAVRRESVPTVSVSSAGFFPSFFAKKATKAAAIRFTASAVSVTFSPAVPAIATPRTSLPFCSASNSFSEIIKILLVCYLTFFPLPLPDIAARDPPPAASPALFRPKAAVHDNRFPRFPRHRPPSAAPPQAKLHPP